MPRFLLSLVVLLGSLLPGMAAGPGEIQLEQIYENVDTPLPVGVLVPDDGTNRQFLILQSGRLVILPKDEKASEATEFLDLTGRTEIEKQFEEGLIGLAFHPEYAKNGKFYVHYTRQDPKQSVISEFQVSAGDPNKADIESERTLLEVRQPFWNHNSGNLLFGPDGFLYVCFGDGGKRDDPLNLAQNLFVLNGKILRIDVDSRSGHRPYGIPEDNPFVGAEGARGEVWAYGLRNPWGTWFDPKTGDLWLADVGQDLWEEVNLITKGGNYGWSYREGARVFANKSQTPPEGAEFIDPIIEYSHVDGLSITGGFVYRGKKHPELQDYYIYSDFITGRIWAAKYDSAVGAVTVNKLIFERPEGADKKAFKFTAIQEDAEGELLFLTHAGKIFRVK